jgi:hypothetical protein
VTAATFPIAVIFTVIVCLLGHRALRAIRFRRLARQLGSRGAARRYLLAREREQLHAIHSLASRSLSSRARSAAPSLGRSAPEGVSRHTIGESFPHLMFTRRQAD